MLITAAKAHVGCTREEWDAAKSAIDVEPRDQRLKAGLAKLVDDRCSFAADQTVDAVVLRRDLFLCTTAARRAMTHGERFDRDAILASFALDQGTTRDAIEQGLFADLRDAHELTA